MAKKYLVHLKDYTGDDVFFVVGEATYKWFISERPACFAKGKTSYNERIPAAVLAEATEVDEEFPKTVCVTSGSCDNDRAIHAMGLFKIQYLPPSGKFNGFYNGLIY